MPRVHAVRTSAIRRTPRVMQVEGMFDMPPAAESRVEWSADLPLDDKPWSVGLIVGPSGCGKSTLARELFPGRVVDGFEWPADKSLIDGFPADMPTREVVDLLSSVGFSSPPEWLRPFHVLSTGQQFRVTTARALAEQPDLAVLDEFTSVVDRQVAQIGSAAVARAVRKGGRRLVVVTCHYDVEAWLQPDWVFTPEDGAFHWRELQRRPAVNAELCRVDPKAWHLFHRYHYLTATMNPSSQCWVATVDGRPAVFVSVLHMPTKGTNYWRMSRVVCLPDYQGVGIGNAVFDAVASMYAASKPVRFVASHPALIRRAARSSCWHMVRKPSQIRTSRWARGGKGWKETARGTDSADRRTASFQWVGPVDPRALAEGVIRA